MWAFSLLSQATGWISVSWFEKKWVSFFFCLSITGDWGGLSHSHVGENFRRRKTESVWSKFAFEVVIVERKSGPWIDPGAPRSKPENNFLQVNLPCGFTEWPLPQTEFSDFCHWRSLNSLNLADAQWWQTDFSAFFSDPGYWFNLDLKLLSFSCFAIFIKNLINIFL